MLSETAPAKINLYLHIGPLRADGLHDLESLFVFARDGDVVSAEPSENLTLTVNGDFAGALSGLSSEDNLIIRAARALRDHAGVSAGAALHLEKNLPVAAGIGGGSADAAAALRVLCRLWDIDIDPRTLAELAFPLGADIPACIEGAPVRVSGAGEVMSAAPRLPALHVCIVNPLIDMPTGPVFRAFDAANPAPSTPELYHGPTDTIDDVRTLLNETRNDLQPPALKLAPVIGDVLAFLDKQPGVLGARMSGSGASCFCLLESATHATAVRKSAVGQGWWAVASPLRQSALESAHD